MEPYAEQSTNDVVGNINPKESIKNILNSGHEFSSNTDEMRTKSVSDINEEASSEILRISSGGSQVGCLKKKLLVLDINGLLVDLVFPPPNDHKADAIVEGVAMFKRPFCLEFLKFCFEKFEVAIWSTRSKKYVEPIIDYLMGDMKTKLLFCWDDSHCTKTSFNTFEDKHKLVQLKDLRKFWDKQDLNLLREKGYYNESNTLLLDDSPHKALLNPPHTSVFPHSFSYLNKCDNSLAPGGDLREYVGGLANVENIPKYVEEHPFGQEAITKASLSWNFYQQFLGSLSASQLEDNVSANLNNCVPSAC